MAHDAKRGRHPLDRGGERRGRGHLGRLEQRADFAEILQRAQLRSGAAFGVAAVGQHLPSDLLRQETQRPGEECRVFRDRDGGGDETLERGQAARVEVFGRQRGRERACVGDEAGHEPLAERVIGGGGKEIVVAEPRAEAGACYRGSVRDRVGRTAGDPVRDQRPGAKPGRVGAEGAQVAQPREAMRGRPQRRWPLALAPEAGAERADNPAAIKFAPKQPRAARGVARPGVANREGRRVRHPAESQARHPRHGEPRVAQPPARVAGAAPVVFGQSVFPAAGRRAVIAAA